MSGETQDKNYEKKLYTKTFFRRKQSGRKINLPCEEASRPSSINFQRAHMWLRGRSSKGSAMPLLAHPPIRCVAETTLLGYCSIAVKFASHSYLVVLLAPVPQGMGPQLCISKVRGRNVLICACLAARDALHFQSLEIRKSILIFYVRAICVRAHGAKTRKLVS